MHSDLVYRLVTALAGDDYDADIEPQQPAEAGTEPAQLPEAIGEAAGPPDQAPGSAPATDFDIEARTSSVA